MRFSYLFYTNYTQKEVLPQLLKRNIKKFTMISLALCMVLATTSCCSYNAKNKTSEEAKTTSKAIGDSTEKSEKEKKEKEQKNLEEAAKNKDVEILINFAGDCTLGTDKNFNESTSLPAMLKSKNNDFSYFFKNVKPIFKKDDLTIVNLEGPLTRHDKINTNKQFNFKGDPELAKALVEGDIEAVNLANNHTFDYGQMGFNDTKNALEANNINYFGADNKYIKEIKGIKFGFLGYEIWNDSSPMKEKIKKDIEEFKSQRAIVVINAHWGIERDYKPYAVQKNMAHFAIDNGADLIIGHHPHVLQSVEKYKDKFIFYSLGNFAFGGNSNPSDKDTIIVQVQYKFKNNNIDNMGVKVIPTSISSVNHKNDYCPTPAQGADKNRIFKKLNALSINVGFDFDDSFHYIN